MKYFTAEIVLTKHIKLEQTRLMLCKGLFINCKYLYIYDATINVYVTNHYITYGSLRPLNKIHLRSETLNPLFNRLLKNIHFSHILYNQLCKVMTTR